MKFDSNIKKMISPIITGVGVIVLCALHGYAEIVKTQYRQYPNHNNYSYRYRYTPAYHSYNTERRMNNDDNAYFKKAIDAIKDEAVKSYYDSAKIRYAEQIKEIVDEKSYVDSYEKECAIDAINEIRKTLTYECSASTLLALISEIANA